mgnify:CR=1 FL=1
MGFLAIFFGVGVYYFLKLLYNAKTRFVFENEIEKREFLNKKFSNLIDKEEVIEARYFGRFFNRNKLRKTTQKKATVKGIIVVHPGKSDENPWRVFKKSEFWPGSLEVFKYNHETYLNEPPLIYQSKGSLIPSKIQIFHEIFSMSDKDLETLPDYILKFGEDYVSPNQKKLIGSINKNDSFDINNKKLKESTTDNLKYNDSISSFFTKSVYLFLILLFCLVVVMISDHNSSNWNDNNNDEIVDNRDNNKPKPKPKPVPDKYFTKNVYWTTNFGPKHRGLLKTKESDYYSSLRNRRSLSTDNGWTYNAKSVIANDKFKLDNVISLFKRIQRDNNYSRSEFADAIVSFVQDIPYSLIDNDVDIYAPVEFLKKYKGDCDTRTIFLHTLLKKFNYDVVIINSWRYAHSILGINLPTPGSNYKYDQGVRYYVWETTSKNWLRGQIHPNQQDMFYWEVSLK